MNDDEFAAMRINVILFAIGAVILALDLFIWRP
jgi:HAMP domain-containing protein